MSDGPRDAERLGLTSQYARGVPSGRTTASEVAVGGREQDADLLGITKADAGRILSRYMHLRLEYLDVNELDLVLKLKRFAGE